MAWGGDPDCPHRWGDDLLDRSRRTPGTQNGSLHGEGRFRTEARRFEIRSNFCADCGAWRGALGLEPYPALFVEHLVEVFEEVRRVLRPDGTLWVNIGDTYATGAGSVGESPGGGEQGSAWAGRPNAGETSWAGHRGKKTRAERSGASQGKHAPAIGPMTQPNRMPLPGLKPKDLIGIPWMLAFALRRAGWWLRGENIWQKPNPMPESTTDRCTVAHEQVFLLAKSERYYFDAAAIAELAAYPPGCGWVDEAKGTRGGKRSTKQERGVDPEQSFRAIRATRNKRSVWSISTTPFPGAHFATMPPALVEPCVLAGTSARGCCAKCGAPWQRVVAPTERYLRFLGRSYLDHSADLTEGMMQNRGVNRQNEMMQAGVTSKEVEMLGWYPPCACDRLSKIPAYPKAPKNKDDASLGAWRAEFVKVAKACRSLCDKAAHVEVRPAVVLDPFGGAATVGIVADRHQRDAVMIELNPEYAEIARRRLDADAGLFARAAE